MGSCVDLIGQHPRLGGMFTNALDVQMIQPIDVSNAVVFLVSDESRCITVHATAVDSGNIPYWSTAHSPI